MKKIIKQELFHDIEIQFNDDFNQYEVEQENVVGSFDLIVIEKSKAREAALAICPELASELKEAVELVKECYGMMSTHPEPTTLLYDKTREFLTKHKSKE